MNKNAKPRVILLAILYVVVFASGYVREYSGALFSVFGIAGFALLLIGFFGTAKRNHHPGIFFPTKKGVHDASSFAIQGREKLLIQIGLVLIVGVLSSLASIILFS